MTGTIIPFPGPAEDRATRPEMWPNLFRCLASELFEIREKLEALSVHLVSHEETMMAHLDELQEFDVLIQRADESGLMIDRLAQGEAIAAVVDKVRLGRFQDRLRTALFEDVRR